MVSLTVECQYRQRKSERERQTFEHNIIWTNQNEPFVNTRNAKTFIWLDTVHSPLTVYKKHCIWNHQIVRSFFNL